MVLPLSVDAAAYGTASRSHVQAVGHFRAINPSLFFIKRDLSRRRRAIIPLTRAGAELLRQPADRAAFVFSETLLDHGNDLAFVTVAASMHKPRVIDCPKPWADVKLNLSPSCAPVSDVGTGLLGEQPVGDVAISAGRVLENYLGHSDHLTAYRTDVDSTFGIYDVGFIRCEGSSDPGQFCLTRVEGAMSVRMHSGFGIDSAVVLAANR